MSRPGVEVSLLDFPGAIIAAPTDTGVWFVAGLTERGPSATPVRVTSLSSFTANFGTRQAYSNLYDALDVYFREGGGSAWVSRTVGPAATQGTLNLTDSGSGTSLVATALGAGAWSSNYKVAVVAGTGGGTYQIQVLDTNNAVLEGSNDLTTQADGINWGLTSKYIRLSLGASSLPPKVQGPTALSAGNDDRANITNTQKTNALSAFTKDLGPGQVSLPGDTASSSLLTAHAENNNRVALCDLPNSATLATIQAQVGHSRFAASFAPWIVVPGLTSNSTRTVPPSALVAGLLSRNDPVLGANQPAAGNAGISRYAIGISQNAWIDDDRETLNESGVNVIRNIYGGIVVYGWRSGTNPITDTTWLDFGNARLFIRLSAELDQVGQNFLFVEIDGQRGHTISAFNDALVGKMLEHYNNGELFGDTADQAFAVDTGPAVNTLETIAALELHAVVYVKMAPFAEWVQIQVVKQAIA